MPEGDVVWRTAVRLDKALGAQRLTTAELRWPDLATVDLVGLTVLQVVSRGKHILARLDQGWTIHSHLRMDGSWHIFPASAVGLITAGHSPPRAPAPTTQIRALLGTDRWLAAGYHLGMLDLVRTEHEAQLVGHLGPDLLDPQWDADRAMANLLADPNRPVGEALLDQRIVAGIGTFYLAETCFLTGTCPWDPIRTLAAPHALLVRARSLLVANRERLPQTTTGSTRRGENAYVYGRTGQPCRRCGTTVKTGRVGIEPHQRTTYFCPRCQPARAAVR